MGQVAAKQDAEFKLRRCVMACLLWEDIAYASGNQVAKDIAELIPQVDPQTVANMAIECRFEQKLRHVPLYIVREMCRHDSHRHLVADTLAKVVHRADELSEFLSIYWKDGRQPVAASAKRGLARAFTKFDEYQLAKWDRAHTVRLRDVLFLTHPKAKDQEQQEMWNRLVEDKLKTPDTWEVGLSASKDEKDKKQVWLDLIEKGKLGAFALLKNLRNMQSVGVPRDKIAQAIETARPSMLLPLDFLKAAKHAPDFQNSLEKLMFSCAAQFPKLPGWTVFVVDVSGSMGSKVSAKSDFARYDVGAAMAMLAVEMCENAIVYATAGCDSTCRHSTKRIGAGRGFALSRDILQSPREIGGGGIFTRQCLEYIRSQEKEDPDRIIIFSDSQDCDRTNRALPKPFGRHNYIIDVSSHQHGVNYDGVWTAEIQGWSEHFLKYIAALEAPTQN
jgi:hypothetical protein